MCEETAIANASTNRINDNGTNASENASEFGQCRSLKRMIAQLYCCFAKAVDDGEDDDDDGESFDFGYFTKSNDLE